MPLYSLRCSSKLIRRCFCDNTKIIQEKIKVILPDDGHPSCDLKICYPAIGDAIKSDDVLCEIETPDYTYDFEAIDEGFLAKIMLPSGTKGVEPWKATSTLESKVKAQWGESKGFYWNSFLGDMENYLLIEKQEEEEDVIDALCGLIKYKVKKLKHLQNISDN